MAEKQIPASFKIKMDLEPDEPPYEDDFKEKRADKPGQKITLASILIFCLLGAALAAGYMDLKGRLAGLQSVGVQQSQSISETLESRFSALSIKQAALEEASAKNVLSLQTALVGIKGGLQKHQKLLDQMVASKADRKELGQIQAELDKNIVDLNAAIKNMEESRLPQISAQISRLGGDLKSSQAQIKGMEGVVAELSKNQIDRKQIAAQIATSEKKMLETIAQIRSNFDSAVKALDKKIDKTAAAGSPPSAAPEKKSAAPSSAAPEKKSAAPKAPGAGTIIEENLQ